MMQTPSTTPEVDSAASSNLPKLKPAIASTIKHYGSESDLPNINKDVIRKRKHSVDLTESFKLFTEELSSKLTEWRSDASRDISQLNDNLNTVKTDISSLNVTFVQLKDEINGIRQEYADLRTATLSLNNRQNKIDEEVGDLQKSMQFHSDSQDQLSAKVNSLSMEADKIKTLEIEMADLKNLNKQFRLDNIANDQRERLLNLEIIGIPEADNEEMGKEDVVNIVIKIGTAAGVALTRGEIVHANRITPKVKQPGRPRIIIAKMSTRLAKDNIISGARKCRLTTASLNYSGEKTPIYVNDNLTPYNKQLLKMVKNVAKTKEYQFVWTRNGKIFARKNDKSPPLHISEEEEIKKKLT